MVKLTRNLQYWLFNNYPDILPLIRLGHVELFTTELQNEYYEWCRTIKMDELYKGGIDYEIC